MGDSIKMDLQKIELWNWLNQHMDLHMDFKILWVTVYVLMFKKHLVLQCIQTLTVEAFKITHLEQE
jgi:hypothetical protein